MNIEKHDLHHEFPEYFDEIHNLKAKDRHFLRLFNEYHEIDHEIHHIEEGAENTTDEYLDGKKKQRVRLKDQLLVTIKKEKASA